MQQNNQLQRKNLENVLKKFNDEEMGGGYLYFLHKNELIQVDLCDYSTAIVCELEDIKSVIFDKKEEGIYIEIEEKYEGVDHVWISESGVQM